MSDPQSDVPDEPPTRPDLPGTVRPSAPMTEQLLPNLITPVTPLALYQALGAADPTLSRASKLVLLAQVGEETGWRACHCYNYGNVKHVAGDGFDYCQFDCTEKINGVWVTIHAGEPGSQFRAFTDAASGAVAYLAILKGRFGAAWSAVLTGDPRAFVRALKAQGYFTGDELTYENNVANIDANLARQIPADVPLAAPVVRAAIEELADQTDVDLPISSGDLPPSSA